MSQAHAGGHRVSQPLAGDSGHAHRHGMIRLTRFLAFAGALSVTAGDDLLAQRTPVPDQLPAAPQREFALGLSFSYPRNVNVRPLCDELSLPCTSPKTFPDFGFVASIARRLTTRVALLGEASAYLNSWFSGRGTKNETNHVYAFLVGPRLATSFFHFRSTDDGIRLFAQLLAGVETSDEVPSRLAFQPGVGIDTRFPLPHLMFRFAIDYRGTSGSGRNLSAARSIFGLVIGWDVEP